MIPFEVIDWTKIEKVEHKGDSSNREQAKQTGTSFWQVAEYNGLRIRLVEYSKDYFADHWCQKGHIVHCLEGEFVSELETGEKVTLTKGMMYIVSDDASSHRSMSENGVKLLIIDGDFLKP